MSIDRVVAILPLMMMLVAPMALAGEDEPGLLELSLGDPARKGRDVELTLDAVTDSRSGETIAPADLPPRIGDVKLLLIGETHTDMDFHTVQLRVIRELQRAGRKVMVGLEMFPTPTQPVLDQWSRGMLTEEGFLTLSEWYKNWGYPWDYYRDIFLFARDNGLGVFALNTPREVVHAVREKGFEGLTEEQKEQVPPQIDTDDPEHLAYFKAVFGAESDSDFHAALTDDQLKAMFDAQCTWDATMGYNAVRVLRQHDDGAAILVVMVGTGHIAYGLGIQRQVRQWYDGRVASVIPIPVTDDHEPVTKVRASYADFVWGVPEEDAPIYPYLGVSSTEDAGTGLRKVIHVAEDSPGSQGGFEVGDLLVSMDGNDLPDRATLMRLLAAKRWGDGARFVVRRGGEDVELSVQFRRQRPEACEESDGEAGEPSGESS